MDYFQQQPMNNNNNNNSIPVINNRNMNRENLPRRNSMPAHLPSFHHHSQHNNQRYKKLSAQCHKLFEKVFNQGQTNPSNELLRVLAEKTQEDIDRVRSWFARRRAKEKKSAESGTFPMLSGHPSQLMAQPPPPPPSQLLIPQPPQFQHQLQPTFQLQPHQQQPMESMPFQESMLENDQQLPKSPKYPPAFQHQPQQQQSSASPVHQKQPTHQDLLQTLNSHSLIGLPEMSRHLPSSLLAPHSSIASLLPLAFDSSIHLNGATWSLDQLLAQLDQIPRELLRPVLADLRNRLMASRTQLVYATGLLLQAQSDAAMWKARAHELQQHMSSSTSTSNATSMGSCLMEATVSDQHYHQQQQKYIELERDYKLLEQQLNAYWKAAQRDCAMGDSEEMYQRTGVMDLVSFTANMNPIGKPATSGSGSGVMPGIQVAVGSGSGASSLSSSRTGSPCDIMGFPPHLHSHAGQALMPATSHSATAMTVSGLGGFNPMAAMNITALGSGMGAMVEVESPSTELEKSLACADISARDDDDDDDDGPTTTSLSHTVSTDGDADSKHQPRQ